ncbi:hypothetical protein [Consotaella salsifontis]|uniref:Cucumopine synthase C-terminal helical bundle domain-containing protein n=1 Tax=Consotaella salsifontis TaxID=1365950 RepID=A0A1T4SNX3_9HYPH|nr:hypothetical protein [Consotaella salsifontis]SKA29857.1 hypothetical protein SAMN05428963_11275 [Consotaella salsifontis]
MTVEEAIRKLEAEREKIWLDQPEEVRSLSEGYVPRNSGSRGQYLSTIIFAEGETRTFADEFLWGIIRVIEDSEPDLKTLQAYIAQVIGYKASFFDFVGLPHACEMTRMYVDAAQACTTNAELLALTKAALGYANRLHMWVDFILPWGLGGGFRKKPLKAKAD